MINPCTIETCSRRESGCDLIDCVLDAEIKEMRKRRAQRRKEARAITITTTTRRI